MVTVSGPRSIALDDRKTNQVSLDIFGAFDENVYESLRTKPFNYRSLRTIIIWTSRTEQKNVFDKVSCQLFPVNYGDPRGLVLAPAFLILFITNLPTALNLI